MKAIIASEPGGADMLQLVDRPKPVPGPGEVLIRVAAAGVNRPDIVQRQGLYPPPPGASDILGLEVSGTVDALGEGVDGVAVGADVCALVTGGGYAEYCTAPTETVLPVPHGMNIVDAAGLPETYFTVWSNVFDRGSLQSGERLLVHGGSSGIGTAAVQLAKAFGAWVATTVGSEEKADFIRALGADLVINYKRDDFVSVLADATGGKGVDVVLDMVGGDYVPRNIAAMAPDGRHVSIAFLRGPQVAFNMLPVMLKRLTLTGSTLRPRDSAFKGAIAGALQTHVWPLFEGGGLRSVTDTVLPLAEARAAHGCMEDGSHMGKILLSTA